MNKLRPVEEVERVEEWKYKLQDLITEYELGRLALSVDVLKFVEDVIHQELQKAREEMLHKLHLCAIGKYQGDALENVKAQIKEYQSELDQPIS